MRKLLEGMSIKVAQDEEAARQVFKEREKKLWEVSRSFHPHTATPDISHLLFPPCLHLLLIIQDIDAAIARAESLAAEQAALAAETERKRLESARLAAEQQAKAKADAEAAAAAALKREAEAKQAAALEAARLLQEEQALAEAREAEEKANRERNQCGKEWEKWVGVQKWMKARVIEPVKADSGTRRGLRVMMRGVTRGLGQVVNTRESIIRVVCLYSTSVIDLPFKGSTVEPLLYLSSMPLCAELI